MDIGVCTAQIGQQCEIEIKKTQKEIPMLIRLKITWE